MQAAFVKHDGFQCGYCTPGQICSAVAACSGRSRQAPQPCHRRPVAAADIELTEAEIARAHERQYLPLRRLSQHRRAAIEDASGATRMRPFTYERADRSLEAAARRGGAEPDAKFIAGGTNLLDLMKLEIEIAGAPRRSSTAAARQDRGRPRRRLAHRRAGAQHRPRRRPQRAARIMPLLSPALLAGASGQLRNKATTARQSAPAHALPLFLRHDQALQQARAGLGLRGHRRLQPRSTPSSAPATRASPRIPPTWRSRCARSMRTVETVCARRLDADDPDRATSTGCPATRRISRRRSQPGELITAVTLPPPPRRQPQSIARSATALPTPLHWSLSLQSWMPRTERFALRRSRSAA